jgi:hypothetical protein
MNAIKKWAMLSVWLTLAAVLTIGCNPLQTVAFFLHKDDKVPPQFPLRPKEGPKKDKDEEIKVLILVDQRQGLPIEFVGTDRELMSTMVRMLPEMAKANKEKLGVVSAAELSKFQSAHPNWRTMSGVQIGKALNADSVLQVSIGSATMYQPGTGRQLYDGKAEIEVNVYDLVGKTPERHYPLQFNYRPNRSPDVDSTSRSLYRQGFIEQLAKEILWKHVEHPSGDEVAP